MTISSELVSLMPPWTRFIDVWEAPEFWVLFLAPNQFITLPIANLSEKALAFLYARLPQP